MREKMTANKEYEYIPLNDQKNYFYTYDLGCASALITMGFQLKSLDKEIPNKVLFIFTRKKGIDSVVNLYWSNQLKGPMRTMVDNIKMLKNRIYSK